MRTITVLMAGLFLFASWKITSTPGDLESTCLSKFKDLNFPFELGVSDHSISNTKGESLTSEMQKSVLGIGGYNEEGFGVHITAIGKVELSKGIYALVYSDLMVPVPAHYDEHHIAIYKKGSKKMKHVLNLAYTRGGPGIDEETMTCKLIKKGSNLEIHQHLKFRKAIETADGPDYDKLEEYEIVSTIDSKGNFKQGTKKKI